MTTTATAGPGTHPCPVCAAPVAPAAAPATATDEAEWTTCDACSHQMPTVYLREAVQLTQWQATVSERLGWLTQQLKAPTSAPAAGMHALTTPVASVGGGSAGSAGGAGGAGSGGGFLLAAGALLLVLAGIAFLAFTWRLLGPLGQISILLAIGAACLVAVQRLTDRLRGTATSIGVVGVFLVSIATIGARILGPDLIGETASLLTAVGLAIALCAAGAWLHPANSDSGNPAIANLAAIAGSTMAITLLATAPINDALPIDRPWSWWVALVCLASGVALLPRQPTATRWHLAALSWIGAGSLVAGSIALAVVVRTAADKALTPEPLIIPTTITLLAMSVAVMWGTRYQAHRRPLAVAALTLLAIPVFLTLNSATASPQDRPWDVVVLLVVAATCVTLGVLGRAQALGAAAAVAAFGAAVGLAVAPWIDTSDDGVAGVASWIELAWPPWRGPVAGLAFVALLVAAVFLARRWHSGTRAELRDERLVVVTPWLASGAALALWLVVSVSDRNQFTILTVASADSPTPESFTRGIAIALAILGAGILVMAMLRRLPAWSTWAVAALALAAVLMQWSTLSLSTDWQPELTGLALAVPTAVATSAWWWLRRAQPTPTWQTITPPFVLALLPSTMALLGDTGDRWWYGADPGTAYQVRMVALVSIGVVAAVVGARQRWAGLFFPGLLLVLVVVAIQLVELGRFLPQWVAFAIAGALLIAAGARWEWVRTRGREGAAWVRALR